MTRTTQPTDPTTARPRTSSLDRAVLMQLAATEYERFTTMLADLDNRDWIAAYRSTRSPPCRSTRMLPCPFKR